MESDPTDTQQSDPLNPHRYVFVKDPENPNMQNLTVSVSMAELPAAPPQPWIIRQPAVPAGQVELHRFKGTLLGNERRVWVYTPPAYTSRGEPYGLLILFDGWEYTQWIPTPTILDNLLAAEQIPPLVTLFLDSPNRYHEFACNPSFTDFLTQELLPWAHQHYHITSKPEQTIIGGISLGGLAAAYAGLRHPEVFGNVLSQSGSFWYKPENETEDEWLARQLAVSPKLPLRFYLEIGLLETAPVRESGPSMLIVNRHMRNILQAKGYSFRYAEFNGRHEYLSWQGTLADGLLFLTGKDKR
jgi:enterochelin esterase family protein